MSAFKRKKVSLGATTLVVLTSALAFALAFGPLGQIEAAASSAPPTIYRFVENGDHASVSGAQPEAVPGNPESACWFYVSVSRGGTGQAQQTDLTYDVSRWDPDYVPDWAPPDWQPGACVVVEGGKGSIPNSAYRVSGTTHTLNVETSMVPGFERWEGSGGAISLVWQKTRASGERTSGTEWLRYPGFSSHRSGTLTEWPAIVTGTLIGVSVDVHEGEPKYATVGSSTGVSVSICFSPDPKGCGDVPK